jgi:hypothetical protein
VAEGEAEVAGALAVKVDGSRVPIDGVRTNLIDLGDIADAMPVNELFFDVFAVRISADQAEAFVVSDWDANPLLHESEFLIWSQGTFAARTFLVFFLGLRLRLRCGRLRGWFGCGRGLNLGGRSGIVLPD